MLSNVYNALNKPVHPDAFKKQESTQARYEIISTPNPYFDGGGGASTQNVFQKLIVPAEGEKTKKFSINLTEAEIKRIQNLYDFLNFDGRNLGMSMDEMIRQMLLQPEMHFQFCQFMGQMGNEVLDHVISNQPYQFGWC